MLAVCEPFPSQWLRTPLQALCEDGQSGPPPLAKLGSPCRGTVRWKPAALGGRGTRVERRGCWRVSAFAALFHARHAGRRLGPITLSFSFEEPDLQPCLYDIQSLVRDRGRATHPHFTTSPLMGWLTATDHPDLRGPFTGKASVVAVPRSCTLAHLQTPIYSERIWLDGLAV